MHAGPPHDHTVAVADQEQVGGAAVGRDDRRQQGYVPVARVQPQREVDERPQVGPGPHRIQSHPRCTGGPAVSVESGVKVGMCAMPSDSARQMPLL